jgi:hypothetical protein
METSGKGLVDHWLWAVRKGLMNQNTANALRAACSQVLAVVDDWETEDLSGLDVEGTLKRFENLRKKDFKPQTLETYKRRFRQALQSFLSYHDDPGNWKPPSQERRSEWPLRNGAGRQSPDEREKASVRGREVSGLVEYPYPLRAGVIARLTLPPDLNTREVRRLTKFMESLVIDFGQEAN